MEKSLLFLLVVLVIATLLQLIRAATLEDERINIKRRLQLINKPFIKSFTIHGDILDCVKIEKQFAFDHPLLKNHSIKLKPNFKVPKPTRSAGRNGLKLLTLSQLLPENIKCPRGTVLVKRIREEDLAMEKLALFGITSSTSNSSKYAHLNDPSLAGHQVANVQAIVNNIGTSAELNVWSPEVIPEQFSQAYAYVASDSGSVTDGVSSGWTVNPYLFENYTRLFTYWNNGGKEGCFDTLCPGFVQVSQKIPVGLYLHPTSIYGGDQYSIFITIQQDQQTKDWWLISGGEPVGYWPVELFSFLANGATRAAWGGEIASPQTQATPAMGSGHFPEEGFGKASVICGLSLIGPQTFPSENDLVTYLTKPDCYKLIYNQGIGDKFGRNIYYGGPPNCQL